MRLQHGAQEAHIRITCAQVQWRKIRAAFILSGRNFLGVLRGVKMELHETLQAEQWILWSAGGHIAELASKSALKCAAEPLTTLSSASWSEQGASLVCGCDEVAPGCTTNLLLHLSRWMHLGATSVKPRDSFSFSSKVTCVHKAVLERNAVPDACR